MEYWTVFLATVNYIFTLGKQLQGNGFLYYQTLNLEDVPLQNVVLGQKALLHISCQYKPSVFFQMQILLYEPHIWREDTRLPRQWHDADLGIHPKLGTMSMFNSEADPTSRQCQVTEDGHALSHQWHPHWLNGGTAGTLVHLCAPAWGPGRSYAVNS